MTDLDDCQFSKGLIARRQEIGISRSKHMIEPHIIDGKHGVLDRNRDNIKVDTSYI